MNAAAAKPAGPKMKSFFWKKLGNDRAQRGVWNDGPGDESADIDEAFLTSMFEVKAKEVTDSKKKDAMGDANDVASHKKSTAVNGQRQQNIGIALSKIKIPLPTLRLALLRCDRAVISEELLETLFRNLPNDDEAKALANEKKRGDIQWNAVESFLYMLSGDIPDARDRLQLWSSTTDFSFMVTATQTSIETVERCVEALMKENSRFSRVLKIILAVGNFMNRGTSHGNAAGFSLENLNMLAFVKANDGKTTMLEVVTRQIQEKRAELLGFADDLRCLKDGVATPLTNVGQQVSALNHAMQRMKKVVDDPARQKKSAAVVAAVVAAAPDAATFNGGQPPEDGLPVLLSACIEQYQSKAVSLAMRYQTLREDMATMLEHYGEERSTDETVVMGNIVAFCKEFDACAKRLAAAAAKAKTVTPPAQPVTPTTPTTGVKKSMPTTETGTSSVDGRSDL